MTQPLAILDETSRSCSDDDLGHYTCCCSPDIGLCCVDLTDTPWGDVDDEDECVVCEDLAEGACERCGRSNYDPCVCGRCEVWT